MGILDLPPELLQVIARYLTIPAALALAKTTPSLEPAADSRVYRDITITHADQFAPTHNLDPHIVEANGPPTHSHTGSETVLKSLGSKTVLQAHLDIIRAKPWRAGHVRKLDVQLGQSIPDELNELLSLVSPGLTDLRLAYPAFPHLVHQGQQVQSLAQVLEKPDRAFPALRLADIQVGTHWSRCLALLLKAAPRLKYLRVKGDAIADQSEPTSPTEDHHKIKGFTPYPAVPHDLALEVLDVGPEVQSAARLLADIVRNSPGLKVATFAGPWWPGSRDPLVSALVSAPQLQILDVPSSILHSICGRGGFSKVYKLTLAWSQVDLSTAADVDITRGLGPLAVVPDMPDLETCAFRLKSYDPGAPSYDVFRGRMFDLAVQAIRVHALRTNFASTPLLQSIDLSDMYGMKNVGHVVGHDYGGPPKEDFAPSPDFDGALITRYFDGPDSLIYIKHRSAFSCGWEQFAVCNGKQMPISNLASVTNADGVKLHEVKPGVRELSKEGWEIIRHWAAQL